MFGQIMEIRHSGACRWGVPLLFDAGMGLHTSEMETLLERVARGDREAFRALYDASARRMLGAARRILGDPDLAEDAVQEAYLRIWRNAGQYDPSRGAVLAWMGRIVRNASLDRMPVERSADRIEEVEITALPAEPADARVLQCLKSLPEAQARALILTYVHGLTHAELADRLSVPLGTAKSWVRRGAEMLRQCIGPKQ